MHLPGRRLGPYSLAPGPARVITLAARLHTSDVLGLVGNGIDQHSCCASYFAWNSTRSSIPSSTRRAEIASEIASASEYPQVGVADAPWAVTLPTAHQNSKP